MKKSNCLTIVLAAGEGTRMRSSRPKVLHTIGGKTLIAHLLTTIKDVSDEAVVVVGPDHGQVTAAARGAVPNLETFVQTERKGTAHAVLSARSAIEKSGKDLLIVFGDTPLVRSETLRRLSAAVASSCAVAVLGFRPRDPSGYGRLITENGSLLAIREDKDASDAERTITLCNAGMMAIKGDVALQILDRIQNNNAKREYYLTDAITIAREMGLDAIALETEEDEVRGINNQHQLAEAEHSLQIRLRKAALENGVSMVAPDTVHLCADTKLASDVIIEPYVVFGPGVVVEEGAVIRSFSHLEGAIVGKGSVVGPFARLRPGARLGTDVKIGNFVEVKEAQIEDGVRANHLSYIGDARVGAKSNIGAGTITCNYDGTHKHRTEIGENTFIGSNSALVAPVSIGDGAYVGSGSVVTSDVPAQALALGRAKQVIKEGWAKRLRKKQTEGKTGEN